MTYIVKPKLHHPKLPTNALGYTLDTVEEKPHAARPKAEGRSRGAQKAERKTAKAATTS